MPTPSVKVNCEGIQCLMVRNGRLPSGFDYTLIIIIINKNLKINADFCNAMKNKQINLSADVCDLGRQTFIAPDKSGSAGMDGGFVPVGKKPAVFEQPSDLVRTGLPFGGV